jgi:hypothetical protein
MKIRADNAADNGHRCSKQSELARERPPVHRSFTGILGLRHLIRQVACGRRCILN